MTRLFTFRSLLIAAGLFTASACDKSETRGAADRAAENVNDQVEDLKEQSRDLAEVAEDKTDDIELRPNAVDEAVKTNADGTVEPTIPQRTAHDGRDSVGEVSAYVGEKANVARDNVKDDVEDIADEAEDVGENARELDDANNEFKYRRMVRVGTLRAVHAVAASQPMMVNAISTSYPFVERDRAEITEKLAIFQMRLDEAGNAIQSLELVEANDWETRNDAASKALERVEDARDDVWEAVDDADLIGDRTSMR